MLDLQNVTKVFPGPRQSLIAVDAVSLHVASHEAVAIRGPSGCGKTTLLLLAGTLLRPTSGEVRIDGVQPYGLSAEKRSNFRAQQVGFVFQQFHLIPYLDVLQNILTANLPHQHPQAKTRAHELLERFGLQERVHHVPKQLSVGEKQRVALARAIFHRPKLLLADEPTGNLDPENASNVLGALREYADDGGAVLMVTHDPHAAQRAHRMITMQSGRLVDTAGTLPASPENVLSQSP
jgi:ABC-type lipoprotein export system ATPase subunit